MADGEVAVVDAGDPHRDDDEVFEGYEYFAVVTDHGNISLYQTEGRVLLWEVV